MNLSGWIVMIISVGSVTGFFIWCVWKVLKTPEAPQHMHAPDDIDTHD
ncbi:MAG: hypothetical protein MUC65_07000 [Pontiellaceae bacterium]|jgi:hypothetical protein|nr:hypothetical protein [Pontiellaceae bacterium]